MEQRRCQWQPSWINALGGISGFGLLGAAVARTSPNLGSALGLWGMAVTVYSTVVSRGQDVVFAGNAEMEVRFGSRPVLEKKSKSWEIGRRSPGANGRLGIRGQS